MCRTQHWIHDVMRHQQPCRYGAPPANLLTPGPQHVDAFRDFAAEAAAAAAGVSSAPRARGAAGSSSSKGAGGPPVAAAPGPAKLADMFKPPKDLLYAGGWCAPSWVIALLGGRWLCCCLHHVEDHDSMCWGWHVPWALRLCAGGSATMPVQDWLCP
jgi:hypothetical protein